MCDFLLFLLRSPNEYTDGCALCWLLSRRREQSKILLVDQETVSEVTNCLYQFLLLVVLSFVSSLVKIL